jgi:hypothetical protein
MIRERQRIQPLLYGIVHQPARCECAVRTARVRMQIYKSHLQLSFFLQ